MFAYILWRSHSNVTYFDYRFHAVMFGTEICTLVPNEIAEMCPAFITVFKQWKREQVNVRSDCVRCSSSVTHDVDNGFNLVEV